MLATVSVLLFPLGLVYAAIRDVASYEIPNWLSVALVADFVILALALSFDWRVIGLHLGAGLVVLVVGALLFAAGLLGGGDGKLMAAAAVWVGWAQLFRFIMVVAVAGGGLALLVLAIRRFGFLGGLAGWRWFERLRTPDHGIPYGVAIGIGGLAVFRDLAIVGLAAGDRFPGLAAMSDRLLRQIMGA